MSGEVSLQVQPREVVIGRDHILYDPQLVEQPSLELFFPRFYQAAGKLTSATEGRGSNFFVQSGTKSWVLRHYRRGGLIGKVLYDSYLATGVKRSRPWREWHLLALLYSEGFPVPRPVAAHYESSFINYRADLITEEIPGVKSLSAHLSQDAMTKEMWVALGRCIRRFHVRGVCHADLNAHNIMLGKEGDFYLLDFDRGLIRSLGRWQDDNLQRLHRSLIKLKTHRADFSFGAQQWLMLLNGYHA